MLNSGELLDIIEIGRTAIGCDQVDELRKTVVKLAARSFAVERANFFLIRSYPSPRLDLDHIIVQGIDQEYLDLYRQHYNQMDPFLKILSSSAQVATERHVISDCDLCRTEYYNDFLRPQSIHYQLVIYLRSGGQLLGTLGLCRAKGEKNFSSKDLKKAQLLESHLAGALQKAIFMRKLTKSSEIINSICPDLPYKGVMVLDESLEPLYMNEEALKAISCLQEDEQGASEGKPPLPSQLYVTSQNLLESAAAQSGAAPVVKLELKSNGTGQSVPSSFRVINCSQNTNLCLIYLGESESTTPLFEQLQKSGLSRREFEVAGLVREGFKNRQIAKKLFISEYTVENHLRSIYEKLGVKNRTSMAHKILCLSGHK